MLDFRRAARSPKSVVAVLAISTHRLELLLRAHARSDRALPERTGRVCRQHVLGLRAIRCELAAAACVPRFTAAAAAVVYSRTTRARVCDGPGPHHGGAG